MRYLIFLAIVGALGALAQLREPPRPSPVRTATASSGSRTRPAKVASAVSGQHPVAQLPSAPRPPARSAATPEAAAPTVDDGEPPPLSAAEQGEYNRVATMFDGVTPALRQCFKASSMDPHGTLEFRYHLMLSGDAWKLGSEDQALELVDSTLPVEEDDAATACMRDASRNLALPTAGSIRDGVEGYVIYWSWYLG